MLCWDTPSAELNAFPMPFSVSSIVRNRQRGQGLLSPATSAAAEEFDSGGLGLTKVQWDARYGPGLPPQGMPFYDLSDGEATWDWTGSQTRTIITIDWTWNEGACAPRPRRYPGSLSLPARQTESVPPRGR